MNPERFTIPDWAQHEREVDLEWIDEKLEQFQKTAFSSYKEVGRGAIVVDTTDQPSLGAGIPFGYSPQEQVEAYEDEDTNRMMGEYDPDREFVVVFLKPEDRTSTYRVHAIPAEPETQGDTRLAPPDIETLIAWEEEGGCEAACPYACWVEPDGTCEHGKPSWLIVMGLI